MQYSFLLTSLLAVSTTAIPLNINLGAYSPALVVGDGEISFGGNQDVTNLMNALEGAAVGGAAANGAKAPAPAAPAAPAVAPPAEAAAPAPVAAESTQITGLQGMGKEISPRITKFAREATALVKRDITGFNAALKYASDALKTGPKIELGTEAAGVGILQSAGTGAGAAAAKPAKRDAPKFKTTVTTMLVRGGPTARRSAAKRSVEDNTLEKRSQGIDAVNLNIASGKIAELTFVETRSTDDEE